MKPIKPKKEYDYLIANIISKWQYDVIYGPILKILKDNVVLNDTQILIHAIQSGTIWYQDGAFYSSSGRFPNNLSLELEKLGAKYSRYGRCYRISKKKLSPDILWYIESINAGTLERIALINEVFKNVSTNIEKELNKIVFEEAVESIFYNLQERLEKNYKEYKIETITPTLTDRRAKEISENYINNLKFWIKEWEPQQISKMREQVFQMAVKGKSRQTIADYLQNQFKITDRKKALFLARNETTIATTSYLSSKYQEDGFTHFKWITNMDGRERPLHRKLNGKVFPFNDPPIIYEDEKKGIIQRGLPGETYNCRCSFIPVTEKNDVNFEQ